jgi:hypothetical protein
METSASSGRTKRQFHRKCIATIDTSEHVLNVVNSYLAYRVYLRYERFKSIIALREEIDGPTVSALSV